MRLYKFNLALFMALIFCMSVMCVAADGGETLDVTAAWVDGDLLRIDVVDSNGVKSALALRLSDYVSDAENKEYISIQAVDLAGNKSGIIEIKNPYYNPPESVEEEVDETSADIIAEITLLPDSTESAVPDDDGSKPFTPDGTGTVIDNVHDGDGKEIFSITTEDGSVFYLIVDRQRSTDNVYLLNAVTLEDLATLAENSGRELNIPADSGDDSTSAIQTPEQPDMTERQPDDTGEEPTQVSTTAVSPGPDPPPPKDNGDVGMYIIIGVVVLAAGGLGYYFKIVKGRKSNIYDDDDDYDENEYDNWAYGDDEDGGDDE
jgi:hypothetical protein